MESTYLLVNMEGGIGQYERSMSRGLHGMLEEEIRARIVLGRLESLQITQPTIPSRFIPR